MRLIVDGSLLLDDEQAGYPAIQQAIKNLQNEKRYVQDITVNGQEINLEQFLANQTMPVRGDQVELLSGTMDELVENTLESGHTYIPKLYSAWRKVIEAWRIGDWESGSKLFAESIDGLKWNLTVLDHLSSFAPRNAEIVEISRNGQNLVSSLLEAWENEDFVQLADLLEYEGLPWLNEWFSLIELFQQQMKLEHLKERSFRK